MAKNDALTDHLIQTSLVHICKEEPDDLNNFTKSFADILNFEFCRLYYILQTFLLNYLIKLRLRYISPTATCVEEFFDQLMFLDPQT